MEYFILTMGGMTLILMALVFVLAPAELLTKANNSERKRARSNKDD
jgi:hypothetical protein